MSRWVERIEDRAFARFGAATSREAELRTVAHRVATLMVAVIRVLAVLAAIVLMLEGGADGGKVALLAVYALTWIVVSTRLEMRLTPSPRRRRAGWTVAGDGIPLVLAMALSGGAESPVRLLLVPLPIVVALVASERVVVAGTIGGLAGYAILGGLGSTVIAMAIELTWATMVGVAVARQRRRSLDRLARVDDLRQSLVTGSRDAKAPEIGREVHDAALGPLEGILARLPYADRPGLAELSTAVADVAGRLRSIVVELHVLTARQGGLRASLEGLVQRRSPAAELTLAIPQRIGEEQKLLVTSLAREALRAIAGESTRHVSLRIIRGDTSLTVQVRASPAPSDPEAGTRGERFLAHAATAGATATRLSGGSARAVVDEAEPERAPGWIPGRSLQDARLLVLLLRVPSIVAVIAAGAVAGASDPRFYLVSALMLAWSPTVLRAATEPSGSLQRWAIVAVPDLVGTITLAALLGDAREALLPLVVAIPPCYGLVVSVPVTSTIVALFLGGLAATGFGSTAFVVAFAWSGAIAVLLSAGTTALDVSLVRNAQNRRTLVRRLAHDAELERRRIAERLHDETLQLLLAARQDLEEAAAGDESLRAAAGEALEAALASLRLAEEELVADADALPGGPREGLAALAAGVADRGGPAVRLELDEDAVGHHDGLVVRLAAELMANAVTHAGADRLLVRLARQGRDVLLEVSDDGRGLDLARVRDAVDRGHVGLASCHERVHASGGEMVLSARPGGGTRVLVTLPARRRDGSNAGA